MHFVFEYMASMSMRCTDNKQSQILKTLIKGKTRAGCMVLGKTLVKAHRDIAERAGKAAVSAKSLAWCKQSELEDCNL
jgi:hypothetical protein